MGWLWWKDDPLSELDPSLKAYLDQQGPAKRHSAKQSATPPSSSPNPTLPPAPTSDSEASTSWRSFLGLSTDHSSYHAYKSGTESIAVASDEAKTAGAVPKESLFQDGRYADIWKNYRPAREIEQAGKSDQERLLDIVHSYRDRQAEVRRAAMENCSIQQLAVHECFKSGSVAAKMTMCRAENKELERCILLQSRFLKALGYLDMHERPAAESEKIQMHADKLYQKMKVQEKAIFDARERGEPLPDFAPLVRHRGEAPSTDEDEYLAKPSTLKFDALPKHLQEKFSRARLEGLEGMELELARRELEQELSSHAQLYESVDAHQQRERAERDARRAAGAERMSDKFKRLFDKREWTEAQDNQAEREAQRQRAQLQQSQTS